jgi:hypothetical protein
MPTDFASGSVVRIANGPSLARSEVLHGTGLASFSSYLTLAGQTLAEILRIIDGIANSLGWAKALPFALLPFSYLVASVYTTVTVVCTSMGSPFRR